MRYDLQERTAVFGENVIVFLRRLTLDAISRPLASQLVRSATSVGANYAEANGASSKKDFRNKMFICKKEAQETKHWLRMMARCFPGSGNDLRVLEKECRELTLIFQKILVSLEKNMEGSH